MDILLIVHAIRINRASHQRAGTRGRQVHASVDSTHALFDGAESDGIADHTCWSCAVLVRFRRICTRVDRFVDGFGATRSAELPASWYS